MTSLPETRESLLVQIRDPGDAAAWERFVTVYRPAVFRLAVRCGLQETDAEDLAQRVMISVSRAIGGWTKDAKRGTFRGWLLRIARNEIINALTRRPKDAGRGGTSVVNQLEQCASTKDSVEALIEDEHRRAIFRWAAEEIRPEFQAATWQAFWLSSVEGQAVDDVAMKLGKSVGAVYAARSRIIRRLKDVVRESEAE